MTTIAYRDGVMAADSGSWNGEAVHRWAKKLAKGWDGTLYGVCGNAAESQAFLNWVVSGCAGTSPKPNKIDDRPSFIVLIAPQTGPIRLLTDGGEEIYDAPYMAIGGGAETALGALFAGADAPLAVKAALEHTKYAHGDVTIIHHSTNGERP